MTRPAERPAPSVVAQLDALFAPWNRTDEPGLVVGVVQDGRLLYRRAFGMASLEHGVANTPATRMRIGSVSKHFTAVLALLLAEESRLDLDAPIRTYIPELEGPGGDPTTRQLLQHRGGSRCYLDLGFIGHGLNLPRRGWPLQTQVRQAGANFAPGTAMIYNNGGYHLVSLAIERVGGAPFERQLEDRLFSVVGMPETQSIPSDHDITPGLATCHLPLRGGRWRRGLVWTEELRGEGAMVSTVDDMLRWMAHLRASPGLRAQLTERPQYADGQVGDYALGLLVGRYRGLDIIHHPGSVSGGSSHMLQAPNDGLDIFIVANGARDALPPRLSERVVDIVLADRLEPHEAPTPAAAYAAWLGDWWSSDTGMVYSLADQDGALTLSTAKALVSGQLREMGEGRLLEPAGTVGRVELTLLDDTRLAIRFGASEAVYERLAPNAEDVAGFARVAVGRYFSPDADAYADVTVQGGTLNIRTSDGQGELVAQLVPLSPRVAYAKPASLLAPFRFTITLDPDADGFSLHTTRTRNLAFRRA